MFADQLLQLTSQFSSLVTNKKNNSLKSKDSILQFITSDERERCALSALGEHPGINEGHSQHKSVFNRYRSITSCDGNLSLGPCTDGD